MKNITTFFKSSLQSLANWLDDSRPRQEGTAKYVQPEMTTEGEFVRSEQITKDVQVASSCIDSKFE